LGTKLELTICGGIREWEREYNKKWDGTKMRTKWEEKWELWRERKWQTKLCEGTKVRRNVREPK